MRVRLDDGPFVAGGQFGGGEVVDVVDGADAAAVHGVGADAVLGVDDVVRGRIEGRAQGRDGAQDAFPDRLVVGSVGEGHDPQPYGRVHGPEEAVVAAPAQGPHRHVLAGRREGLGEGEGVDDAAARFGGVAEQGDLHEVVSR